MSIIFDMEYGLNKIKEIILRIKNQNRAQWVKFTKPIQVFSTFRLDEVEPYLTQIDSIVNSTGLTAAGFISYEAAPAFDHALQVKESDTGFPLLCFGLFKDFQKISPPKIDGPKMNLHWEPSISYSEYQGSIKKIKEYIAMGQTYQVNYTYRLRADFTDDPFRLFCQVLQTQKEGYGAYVDFGDWVICSFSPELFFTLNGETLTCRPMKGTMPRGLTAESDSKMAEELYHSEKNRAENLMIVDMVRNDLGRVCKYGSIKVSPEDLCRIEKYPTLWQMTTSVTGKCGEPFLEIMKALFPCASITGAPKISAMKIINELESDPRRIYTGAIGYLSPGRKAQFNVAIRTICVDRREKKAEYGVGGGIVWDSNCDDEYQECITKANLLNGDPQIFSLVETMLWTPEDGIYLFEDHIRRLQTSAFYFDFPMKTLKIKKSLLETTHLLDSFPHKIRLLLSMNGEISISVEKIQGEDNGQPVKITLALQPIDSNNRFLYHKTTQRRHCEGILDKYPGFQDVLFWNEKGEITETTIANVAVKIMGEWITPPVEAGLLSGTKREELIRSGKIKVGRIIVDDLGSNPELAVFNSVRGWRGAQLTQIQK